MKCLALMGLLPLGCGDDAFPSCPVEVFAGVHGKNPAAMPRNCIAALRFAARDSSAITPAQSEVDLYFERWSRAVLAEPVLVDRAPMRYRGEGLIATIRTTNARVITVLSASPTHVDIPPTGDDGFDDAVRGLVRAQLIYKGANGTLFEIASSAVFNEELLHARLVPTGSELPDPVVPYQDDGRWAWSDPDSSLRDLLTADISFRFGWGDCLAGCAGFHDLRAVVPPTGTAMVFDMGGDPLPPDLVLSPNTIPPPE